MRKLAVLVLGILLFFLFSLPSTAKASEYDIAVSRLKEIRQDSAKISEEELDQLLINILAAKEDYPLAKKRVQVRKILAWASQLFHRDMDINFGEKENLPPRAEALIVKLKEIKDTNPPFGWSASSNNAIQKIIENEAKPISTKISDQELDKLLLAVWNEDISFKRKKKEIEILLYFASKNPSRRRSMPPIIFSAIKKEEDLKRKADAEEQEKLRLKSLKEEEARKAEHLKVEGERRNKRLKDEKQRLRSVKQCSKEWDARKAGIISGAFGIGFGCKFNPDLSIAQYSLTDGTPMYLFHPINKFRSFDRYFVLITPKTHQVYSIWAVGDIENTEIGKKEQAVIVTLLEGKYGKREENNLVNNLYDAVIVRQNDRDIMVKVSGVFGDHTIDVRYYDNKIKALAEKERIEMELKNVDSAGF